MAKQGMKRPEISKNHPNNTQPPVPEIQGRAKHGHHKAAPIIAGTEGPSQKLWHTASWADQQDL